eukprot:g20070.t1
MVVFETEGGEDDGDELCNWFGEDIMQAVEVCLDACSSASEGLIFGGYAGDSANCTSSEESNMEWSDMEQTPLQTPQRTPQGALPNPNRFADRGSAAQQKSASGDRYTAGADIAANTPASWPWTRQEAGAMPSQALEST